MKGGRGDPYEALELKDSDTVVDEDVKRAYLRLAKLWHPDCNKSAGATERFKVISEAYDLLKDERRREQYRYRRMSSRHSYGSDSEVYGSYRRGPDGYSGSERTYSDSGFHYNDYRRRRGGSPFSWEFWTSRNSSIKRGISAVLLFTWPLVATTLLLTTILSRNRANEPNKMYFTTAAAVSTSGNDRVEAWFNPRTNRWETPAPWDPAYKQAVSKTPNQQVSMKVPVNRPCPA